VDAGARAFSQHGFDGTRIAVVAREAGVANATFYRYFDNKEQLYREVVNQLVEDLAARIRQVHGRFEHDAPDEGDRAEVNAFVEFVEQYPGIIGAFWADGPNGHPMNLLAHQRELELGQMLKDGTIRDDIDLAVTARAEAYLLLACLCWWDETREVGREALISSLSEFRRRGTRPSTSSKNA
jgi:AcrR family transcriptional regulator